MLKSDLPRFSVDSYIHLTLKRTGGPLYHVPQSITTEPRSLPCRIFLVQAQYVAIRFALRSGCQPQTNMMPEPQIRPTHFSKLHQPHPEDRACSAKCFLCSHEGAFSHVAVLNASRPPRSKAEATASISPSPMMKRWSLKRFNALKIHHASSFVAGLIRSHSEFSSLTCMRCGVKPSTRPIMPIGTVSS